MNSYFTALDIATAYSLIFKNDIGTWLFCHRKVDLIRCRCLDEIELNIVLLWLGNPSQKNDFLLCPPIPYTVGVKHSKSSGLFKGISWCNPNSKLKFVDHHNLCNTNSVVFSGKWYCLDRGINLLFFLLCLRKVNTQPCREKIAEYYFLSDWGAFCKYARELANCLNSPEGASVCLKEHLLLLQDVLAWYNGETTVVEDLKTELEDTLYNDVRSNIDKAIPTVNFILNSFDETYERIFNRGTVYINQKLVENILKIMKNTKNEQNSLWKECISIFENIYNSLDGIAKKTLHGNEELMDSLDSMKNLILR